MPLSSGVAFQSRRYHRQEGKGVNRAGAPIVRQAVIIPDEGAAESLNAGAGGHCDLRNDKNEEAGTMPSRLSYVFGFAQARTRSSQQPAEVLDALALEAVFAADRQAPDSCASVSCARPMSICWVRQAIRPKQSRSSGPCNGKNSPQIITIGDSAYPDRLRAIPDPPTVLRVRRTPAGFRQCSPP